MQLWWTDNTELYNSRGYAYNMRAHLGKDMKSDCHNHR